MESISGSNDLGTSTILDADSMSFNPFPLNNITAVESLFKLSFIFSFFF